MNEERRFKCIGGCADGQWVKNHPRERQIKLYHRGPLPMSLFPFGPPENSETVPNYPSSIYRIETFSVYDRTDLKSWWFWVETNLSLAEAMSMLVEGYREPAGASPE